MEPAAFAGLINANLTQINPAAAGCRTLYVNGKSGFLIEDVNVDMGGDHLSGNMAQYAGVYINNCNRFHMTRVEAYNGGPTTAIAIHGSNTFELTDVVGRDCTYDASLAPTDDVMQGLLVDASTNWTATRCGGRNLVASAPVLNPDSGTSSTAFFTRGFIVTGSSYATLNQCGSENVDQGIDFTGTIGNHHITLNAPYARNCGTHGIKFANSSHDVTVNDGLVEDSGLDSFTVQGMSEPANPDVERITFNRCTSRRLGSNGLWPSNARWHYSVTAASPFDFPRLIAINDSVAEDTVVPTSTGGFKNESNAGAANTLSNCSAPGCPTFEQGF